MDTNDGGKVRESAGTPFAAKATKADQAVLVAIANKIVPALASKTCFLRVRDCSAVQNFVGVRLDQVLANSVLAQLCKTIEELGFDDCKMVGKIPAKLWTSCTRLTELRLNDNALVGDVMGGAGACVFSQGLHRFRVAKFRNNVGLDTSLFWKGIAAQGASTCIEYVSLVGTSCDGILPTKIGQWAALEHLHPDDMRKHSIKIKDSCHINTNVLVGLKHGRSLTNMRHHETKMRQHELMIRV